MRFNTPETLCWKCAKACGDCCWSDHWKHEPVPGWRAEPRQFKTNGGLFDTSYCVLECPEFESDPPRFIRRTK